MSKFTIIAWKMAEHLIEAEPEEGPEIISILLSSLCGALMQSGGHPIELALALADAIANDAKEQIKSSWASVAQEMAARQH